MAPRIILIHLRIIYIYIYICTRTTHTISNLLLHYNLWTLSLSLSLSLCFPNLSNRPHTHTHTHEYTPYNYLLRHLRRQQPHKILIVLLSSCTHLTQGTSKYCTICIYFVILKRHATHCLGNITSSTTRIF